MGISRILRGQMADQDLVRSGISIPITDRLFGNPRDVLDDNYIIYLLRHTSMVVRKSRYMNLNMRTPADLTSRILSLLIALPYLSPVPVTLSAKVHSLW